MRRAAAAAWSRVRARWPQARHLAVLCGPGNNGGDGYALAVLARNEARQVQLVQIGAVPRSEAAAPAVREWTEGGGQSEGIESLATATPELIVDALLGIGLTRPVDGLMSEAINWINVQSAPCVALDLPSGLDADTGQPNPIAVAADLTVSFIAPTIGCWTGRGADFCGERSVDHLAVPSDVVQSMTPLARFLPPIQLPSRQRSAHKGHHGHVLIIGGAPGMAGAALLAGRAALRTGAGWVSMATHPAHATALVAAQPELMVHAVADAGVLKPLLARASVVVIGPGLGLTEWGTPLFDAALASGRPLVIDADGLNRLALRPQSLGGAILTPHPGEAARLLRFASSQAVERDRLDAVRRIQRHFQAVTVLKGAGTLVDDGEQIGLCPTGNPGMAVAGMGDVLSGILGALMAQGVSPTDAARIGVRLHADAGDRAASRHGERGLLPSDLIDALSEVIRGAGE